MPRDVKAYLSKKKVDATDEDIAHEWAEIDEFYSKRYIHHVHRSCHLRVCLYSVQLQVLIKSFDLKEGI